MNRTWIVTSMLALVPALASAQAKPEGTGAPPAAGQVKPEDAKKPYAIGSAIDPATAFLDLEGKPRTLKEWAGKTIVIDFWSIECPISKGYEARLKKLATDYAKKGVVFLAIDSNVGEIGKGDYTKVKEYVKKEALPYTAVLADVGNIVADRFNAQTTPHLFIIDDKGKLRYIGGVDDDPDFKKDAAAIKSYAAATLDALLAGKEPPQTTTKNVGCTIKRKPATG